VSEFSDKIRTIGVISRLSKPVVSTGIDENGERFKETTDELGNTVTELSNQLDVTVRPRNVTISLGR